MRFSYWWGYRGSGFRIGWGVLRGCLQRRGFGGGGFRGHDGCWGVVSAVVHMEK